MTRSDPGRGFSSHHRRPARGVAATTSHIEIGTVYPTKTSRGTLVDACWASTSLLGSTGTEVDLGLAILHASGALPEGHIVMTIRTAKIGRVQGLRRWVHVDNQKKKKKKNQAPCLGMNFEDIAKCSDHQKRAARDADSSTNASRRAHQGKMSTSERSLSTAPFLPADRYQHDIVKEWQAERAGDKLPFQRSSPSSTSSASPRATLHVLGHAVSDCERPARQALRREHGRRSRSSKSPDPVRDNSRGVRAPSMVSNTRSVRRGQRHSAVCERPPLRPKDEHATAGGTRS